jgi:four helix bundle protein
MDVFEHERLDVYRAAIDFLVIAETTASELPRGRGYIADQLRRAACSVVLNIAEGVGEFAPVEKARFYRIARRSATESAAILDVCRKLTLIDDPAVEAGRTLLLRVVAMLTAMARKVGESGSGSRTGSGSTE